jgi:hypothetical protein
MTPKTYNKMSKSRETIPLTMPCVDYRYDEPARGCDGVKPQEFHMNLPYEQIKVRLCVAKQKNLKVLELEKSSVRTVHGS